MSDMATREAYGRALEELGRENGEIVVLDADLSGSTQTKFFAKAHPGRFFNMGVAEQDMMGTAAGFAAMGKIVFASTFAMFATGRAWEIVRQSIAYPHLNVKIAATHAGLTVGEDGASHQALEDIALMRVIPGMSVFVPADEIQTRAVIRAVAAFDGPCYIRLSRAKSQAIFNSDYEFKIGKGKILKEGGDVALVACGLMLKEALDAAKVLELSGIRATVIDMASVKPLDTELLLQVAKTCRAFVTLEEHSIVGGLGGAVVEFLSEVCPRPVYRIGTRDEFGQSGSGEELLAHYRLKSTAIAEDIVRFLNAGK